MNDQGRTTRWLLLVGLVAVSLMVLYPPSEKLKGGIDLVGGSSLLFEIDTSGMTPEDLSGLSSKAMRILKERVDPQGQLNLEWRPVGNTRLEIRMPRPPKEAMERREAFDKTLKAIEATNVKRRELEQALLLPAGEQRAAALGALERGVTDRKASLEKLSAAYDARIAAQSGGDAKASDDAAKAYEAAVSSALSSNLPVARLTDTLALANAGKREQELKRLREEYGSRETAASPLLTQAITAYDAWAKNKADLEDPSDLKRRIRGAGVLEFRILADRDPGSPGSTTDPNPQYRQEISKYVDQLAKFGPRIRSGDLFQWLPIDSVERFTDVQDMEKLKAEKDFPGRPILQEYAGKWYVLTHVGPQYGLFHGKGNEKRWSLLRARPDRNMYTGENIVSFSLDARGGVLFGDLTGANVKRQLCIVLDGAAMSHATINERITDSCQISGRFTPERALDLATVLEAGSLPARLKETPLSEETIGPSLGQTNRERGMRASMYGAIAVLAFVVIYYGFAGGGIASIALSLNVLFTLAVMALMEATFTLPGIAGMVLTVGIAVDANVLIFERFREERAKGLPFKKALNAAYDRVFTTILDSNMTTMITCVILGYVSSEEVKGFAIVLGIGLATSMFTALTVTRLVFNTLISNNLLSDLRMIKLMDKPNIDWMKLRGPFWAFSGGCVVVGMGLFLYMSFSHKEAIYDIEFLGGTSVQIDLKPGVAMSDEQVFEAISGKGGGLATSAAGWLVKASEQLPATEVAEGTTPGRYVLKSTALSGRQLASLMRETLDTDLERDGLTVEQDRMIVDAKPGRLTAASMKERLVSAAERARQAADRLGRSRIQSVGLEPGVADSGLSYEVVTTETSRDLVQEAIVSVFGDRLAVQRAIPFTLRKDGDVEFFVVEEEDAYLSDALGGDAAFDVRNFRGGVAIEIQVDSSAAPVTVAEVERRLREVGLQPEFEQLRARESTILPLGAPAVTSGDAKAYHRFALVAVDENLRYDLSNLANWSEQVAGTEVELVKAALGSEKSFSKVVQFAPQIAGQTRNQAMFAMFLAFIAIIIYVWFRFGTKEHGVAGVLCLVHDVCVTLGAVAVANAISGTAIGKFLGFDGFRIDLPMIGALLTLIGFSINDTIVIFDRVRETQGKMQSLSARIINDAINLTFVRSILTSFTAWMVVFILYLFGGDGVHGFAFALVIGFVFGSYSTIGVASSLLYRPRVLWAVAAVVASLMATGVLLLFLPNPWGWIMSVVAFAVCLWLWLRSEGIGVSGARTVRA